MCISRFQKLALLLTVFLLLSGCRPESTFPSTSASKTPTTPIPTSTATTPRPHYTLQRPDFQQLLGLISEIRSQAYKYMVDDSWQGRVTSDALSMMDSLIANDLKHYYAQGIPGASQYIEKIPADWQDMFSSPTEGINEILFQHSIVDYFNEKPIRFSDKQEQQFSTFSVKPNLLNGDEKAGQAKWLLQIDLTKQEVRYWMTLAQDQNGKYIIIPNNIQTGYLTISNYSTELITKVDINNDKKNDILLLQGYYFAGGLSQTLFIYTERNQGFYLLDSLHLPHVQPLFAEVNSSEYEIGDHNQDGLLDIQITTPDFAPFNCSWKSKIIVQFNGEKRTDENIDKDIPDKSSCNLANMLRSSDLDKTIVLLKSARDGLPKDASSDLRSWIQLRLAMAKYANGQNQEAVQELNAISRFSPTGSFQQAVQDAYDQTGPVPLLLCETLNTITRKKIYDGKKFDSDIDVDLAAFGGYPLYMQPIREFVCPYIDIINFRLQAMHNLDEKTPTVAFSKIGLTLSGLYPLNLDEDADNEWIGLLGIESPEIVLIDHLDATWKITDESFTVDSIANFQVKSLDVTEDGNPEIILSFSFKPSYKDDCENGKHYFMLDVWQQGSMNNSLLTKTFDCIDQSPMQNLSAQDIVALIAKAKNVDPFGDVEYPVWANYEFNHGNETSLLNDIVDLDKIVLANTQPTEARAKIEALLQSLPAADAAADVLRERFSYMTGLSYELQGDDENALRIYLHLIEAHPDSLWSKLAASRISPDPLK